MKLLSLVFDPQLKTALTELVQADSILQLSGPDQFMNDFDSYKDGDFSVVVCEVQGSIDFASEVGQVMRNQCPGTPSYAIVPDKMLFQPKVLKKNGFNDVFLFPVDRQNFHDQLSAALAPEALAKRALKRVFIPDIQVRTKLGIATYVHLPMNKKHLVFTGKDEEFSAKKAEKLKQHSIGSLYIERKDSSSFYEYVAGQMRSADNTLSETERSEKLQGAVRGIFREMFDQKAEDSFESGRELLDSCRKMVSSYILSPGEKGDFHSRLIRTIGGSGLDYSHAADVSTIAVLFALAIGRKADDIAIAGFMHDLSLANFPLEYGYELDPAWPDDLRKEFSAHPQTSVNQIKTKKMIVSPEVEKIILQHHERFDGKGFPRGLAGDRIVEDAQILSLADQFHYLTITRTGMARLSPAAAFDRICANGSIGTKLAKDVRAALGLAGS